MFVKMIQVKEGTLTWVKKVDVERGSLREQGGAEVG